MSCYFIIGVRLDNRVHNAAHFQQVLTENGCNIRVRLGLHEASEKACANDGIIVLQPCGTEEEVNRLVDALNKLEGVQAKLIDLN
ncbi:MAG: hypothetical protein ACOYJB_05610 [Christensenellaceae bacterium]|jgi:hypothetical protein